MFRRNQSRRVTVLGLLFAMLPAVALAVEEQAEEILKRIDVRHGICVLLDPQPARLAVRLARQSRLTVYLQLPTDKATDSARARVDAAGLLGTRIYVEKGQWSHIHLADNLADVVVVTPAAVREGGRGSCRDELLRVVNPPGKVLLGDKQLTKPYPDGIDDWTHPYHGPDNNPQSTDRLARWPYLTQFLAEPYYVPFPEVTVASAGRVFKAFGHVSFKRRCWPWLNKLVAINGYNGTLLWKRPLEEDFNIHRNTMIATPEVLYLADSKSCKLLDASTGRLEGEITAPRGSTGLVWKWMAIENGILYALVGEKELRDKTRRGTRTNAGWPWKPMTLGYDQQQYPWGFGRTFFAVDLRTKRVLWKHIEREPIDGRAVCMKGGRIFYYSQQNFLACLDASKGTTAWRTADASLLDAIGPTLHAQRPDWGFNSSSYLKCSDKAVYFAGPGRRRLVAVSADDGRLLWQYPHGNFQLVLRHQGLYAMGRTGPSKLLHPLSGRVLANLPRQRGNCTRATGTIDSIFARGPQHGGTLRLEVAGGRTGRIALMRPDCHDGVITAGGLMYWGPWMCDCNLSLVGIICLGPAGDFDFEAPATEAERLRTYAHGPMPGLRPIATRGDWPTYRADNRRSATTPLDIPKNPTQAWQYRPPAPIDPAAPITAGGMVFTSGSDGVIRALAASDGQLVWKGYTGGPIVFPPAIDQGRLLVGSGDGWVYCFQAASGRPLWQFRAAPAERKINLYGRLSSTWPVASGVLVDEGVVYAAAGIASYDGTHVYALDAATGKIRWQNNTSGRLAGNSSTTGVSVQGHLLLHRDRLYLAGGNVVSPAVYDIKDGRCLNTLSDEWVKAPRGRDLFLVDDKVVAFDRLLYGPKEYWAGRYFPGPLLQAGSAGASPSRSAGVFIRSAGGRIMRVDPNSAARGRAKPIWTSIHFRHAAALAMGKNAVVVAGRQSESRQAVTALALEDGRLLWSRPLPAMPAAWGLALDHAGRIFVTLRDGRVLCFAD